jgi:ribose transport system ATP-binding protein
MKDAHTMGAHDIGDLDHDRLVNLIIGEMGSDESRALEPAQLGQRERGPVVFEARDLTGGPLQSASLEIHAGEVLGIGGLVGAGRSSLLGTLFGQYSPSSGSIHLDGREVRFRSPTAAVDAGIALIPEERRRDGLLLQRSIRENTVLTHMRLTRMTASLPLPSRRRETRVAEQQIQALSIAARGPGQKVASLSGGNQQKVLLSRWLVGENLRVLLLDEPTKGIDVGAKAERFASVRKLADEGVAVVLVSSDLEEVAQNCDRVAIMSEGRIVSVLDGPTSEAEILERCYGAQTVAV